MRRSTQERRTEMDNTMLCHYGILNMKWGVRRYQNKDGSLTPAGEKRYAKSQNRKEKIDRAFDQTVKVGKDKSPISPAEKIGKEANSIMTNASKIESSISNMKKRSSSTSKTSSMTDAELRAAIDRLRLEQTYNELSASSIKTGADYANSIIGLVGGAVGIGASTIAIISQIKNLRS